MVTSGRGRGGDDRGGSRRGSGAGRDGSGVRRHGPADRRDSDRAVASGRGGRARRGADRGLLADDKGVPRRSAEGRSASEQAVYDGPPIPDEITGRELDRSVLDQLRGLPEKLAARVARHLAAAGRLIDEEPETAYRHTLAARARAARVAVVREAAGEAAYAAGHFGEALAELRAAKRMNGAIDYLPVMADCERALGRPERALALAQNPAVARLPTGMRAEMTIVEAGARFDLGEVDAALRTLENAPLRSVARADWVARLRYAYADLLLKAGRPADALEWFHRTEGVDGSGLTDAAERVAELEAALRDR
jgi:tetratricopeptide (TPR) repeat protein